MEYKNRTIGVGTGSILIGSIEAVRIHKGITIVFLQSGNTLTIATQEAAGVAKIFGLSDAHEEAMREIEAAEAEEAGGLQ